MSEIMLLLNYYYITPFLYNMLDGNKICTYYAYVNHNAIFIFYVEK